MLRLSKVNVYAARARTEELVVEVPVPRAQAVEQLRRVALCGAQHAPRDRRAQVQTQLHQACATIARRSAAY